MLDLKKLKDIWDNKVFELTHDGPRPQRGKLYAFHELPNRNGLGDFLEMASAVINYPYGPHGRRRSPKHQNTSKNQLGEP